MIILESGDTLQIVLGGSATTDQPEFVASYADEGATPTIGRNIGETNGTTPVTLVAGPASGSVRAVRAIQIHNRDTTSVTVTIQITDGVDTRVVHKDVVSADGNLWYNGGEWGPAQGSLAASLFWGKITDATVISITGATTATINRLHSINLTSAAATITLPAASGNSGNVVGFLIASTNTKTVTIDGNASETIDGVASLTMHKNGILLLLCDGTGWRSLVRDLAPGVVVRASSDAGQSSGTTTTILQYEDEAVDTHAAWDGTTFTAPVDGVYAFSFSIWFAGAAAYWVYTLGTADRMEGVEITSGRYGMSGVVRALAGQTIQCWCNASAAWTRVTSGPGNALTITRIGDLP